MNKIEHLTEEKKGKIYFDALETFDSWNPNNRIVIYYEDLITYPEKTLKQILLFLNESPQKLALFMKDYEKHQKKAIAISKILIPKVQIFYIIPKKLIRNYERKLMHGLKNYIRFIGINILKIAIMKRC